MNILLTGATGFVGSYMLSGLLEAGHAVIVLKRSFSKVDRIERHLKKCNIYDLDRIGIKLLFPLQLLSLGIEHGVKHFINTDSFFADQIKLDQDLDKELYMCGYTLSKKQFHQWGRMFAANYGIDFINMKLEHVYGEKDGADKFIPYVVERCKNNIPVLELSEGIQERDFIHISDVVNAYIVVISNLEKGNIHGYRKYDVGTGRSLKLREFVEIIHEAVKSDTLLKWGAIEMKSGEIIRSQADNAELKNMGWTPEIVEKKQIEHVFSDWGRVNYQIICCVPLGEAA